MVLSQIKKLYFPVCLFLLTVMLPSCQKDEKFADNPSSAEIARYTGASYGDLKSPYINFTDSNSTSHETIWTCMEFGSYPQAEVLACASTAVDDYALDDGFLVSDGVDDPARRFRPTMLHVMMQVYFRSAA